MFISSTPSIIKPAKVDRSKLVTQSAYAEMKKISRARVNQLVKEGSLNTVEIKGAVLILLD